MKNRRAERTKDSTLNLLHPCLATSKISGHGEGDGSAPLFTPLLILLFSPGDDACALFFMIQQWRKWVR